MNETELLFTEVLGCSRTDLYLGKKRLLSRSKARLISRALKRRISGEPIQYILGHTEFMGLEFRVNPQVLIPRPDTEILVESALKYATDKVTKSQSHRVTKINILEIGTGSGCIAVSVAKFCPGARVTATDISAEALKVARKNAKLNRVEKNIGFQRCDLFPPQSRRPGLYDLILSNPPYIKRKVIDTLEVEVRQEPRLALDGGEDGLDFYRRIFREAPGRLKPGGLLVLEIGFDQKKALEKILRLAQIFEVKEVIKDYNNINRVLVLKLKG